MNQKVLKTGHDLGSNLGSKFASHSFELECGANLVELVKTLEVCLSCPEMPVVL